VSYLQFFAAAASENFRQTSGARIRFFNSGTFFLVCQLPPYLLARNSSPENAAGAETFAIGVVLNCQIEP
jgi:hypothetical protein